MGVLLNLDYHPSRDPTLQTDLIARHLRTAYSAPVHREYFYSGYPSEPVLSLAALRHVDAHKERMTRSRKEGDPLVDLFTSLQTDGAIDMS